MSETIPSQPATDPAPATPVTPPAPVKAASGNPVGNLISRMTLTQLTLAALVVVFVWQWLDAHYQLNQVQQEVARRLAEVEGSSKANQTLVTQNQELVRELGGKLSLLENKFAETQSQRAALDALYQEMSSSRDQTALADVEQMVLIADQQLQLSANVKAALIALQHAEGRLQRLDRPAFSGMRTRINSDIERLRALPSIDVPAINQQLDKLIVIADTMPLAQDARIQTLHVAAAPSADSAWSRFWRELWQELRGLVRIENTQQAEMPLLSPTQTFFLRENLKLRLISARLALLSRDELSFQRELSSSQAWVNRYFDSKSNEASQALASMQKLASANITLDVPDISGSLEAVRNYRATHERGAR
ncbi:MAG: uroporphyrinogen-III C-methyltransferase [Gallionella sp.]|nr:uroporphyrinogen-III C-methyltransferase [Gallionella sp.]